MARYFNTTGPCRPDLHYMLPPEARLPDLVPVVDQQLYFVVHAPRQTGKTTAMRAFAERLRSQGVAALWATLEASQGIDDIERAEPLWLRSIARSAGMHLSATQRPPDPAAFLDLPPGDRLYDFLHRWSASLNVPVVLLLDEADVVGGPALVSLLRQLRAGFMDRGLGRFPVSIGLIGMRDLRDYLAASKDGAPVSPGSPFNVKAGSFTLRNFTEGEVGALLAQHTEDTGQPFLPEARHQVWHRTQGQPFLVNALARSCVMELVDDPTQPVTAADVAVATELLVQSRTTHLDSLAQRLREPRVAQVVQAVLLGDESLEIAYDSDDFQYVVDLGLLRLGAEGAAPANPIYREVLARQLSYNFQAALPRPWWPWARPDGRLDFPALVEAFRQWWRENADILGGQAPAYPEAVPHLAFMAFLQRVVNGGGHVTREFAAGRGAVDLLVAYGPDRFVVELKRVRPRDSLEAQRARGIAQTVRYLETVGEEEGWLLLFDARSGRSWRDRLFAEDVDVDGKRVFVRGA